MTTQTSKAQIIRIDHSAVFLPAEGPSRLPRAPKRKRPERFWQAFENKALFYDCFWDESGHHIILVSPPPLNLRDDYRSARFVAQPSGRVLSAQLSPLRSTMLTRLEAVPAGTRTIEVDFAGHFFSIPVQPNQAHLFEGQNIITTMNKNNDLEWITQWLDWHATLHNANAVVVFDNGSDQYSIEALEKTLASVEGVRSVCVVNWPYSYGPYDPGVIFHRHWANFLQVASFQMLHRRLAWRANAILNCDIDELVGKGEGPDVFATVKDSPIGLVTLRGQWVELAVAEEDQNLPHHLRYRYTSRTRLKSICANKWALDPSRDWLEPIDINPSVHRIHGIRKSVGRNAPTLPFWHFKAINTNWKTDRRQSDQRPAPNQVRLDGLDREVQTYLKSSDQPPHL